MSDLRVLCVGKIVDGAIDWDIAPLPVDEPLDDELQRLIDESADTDEYEQDMEDRMFWARGEW